MTTKLRPNHQPGYRPDIDGLRAIAIISVVMFHAFPEILPGGFVGVDVFFVISGFLISSIILRSTSRNEFSFLEFYLGRIRRLLPALSVVLIATFFAGWHFLMPKELAGLGKQIEGGAAFAENFLLWREAGYFDTASELKPLMHLWSLGIEEQFYFIYPALLWIAARRKINPLFVVAGFALLSFALNIYRVSDHHEEAFFLLHTRFWELLVGGLIACLRSAGPTTHSSSVSWIARSNVALSLIGISLVAISSLVMGTHSKEFPGWWALLPVVGTAFSIWSANDNWVGRYVLGNRVFVYVGLISYPLYLWHWPLLSFARIVEVNVSAKVRFELVLASFVLASITYYAIERPVRFSLPKKIVVPVLLCGLLLAGGLGYQAVAREGFPSRLPKHMQEVATYTYDFSTDARALSCWLTEHDTGPAFARACYDDVASKKKPRSIVVWGDSYAARLYPGIESVFGKDHAIAQFTRNSCPPVLNLRYKNCIDSNTYVEGFIHANPNVTVVMFAVWNQYAGDWSKGSPEGQALLRTIDQLKRDGVKDILVLGPAPKWEDRLPTLVLRTWKNGSVAHDVPYRMATGLDRVVVPIDRELPVTVAGEDVRYYSVLGRLCDKDGCLVRGNDSPTSFTTWDVGHLTTVGAEFVARDLPIQ